MRRVLPAGILLTAVVASAAPARDIPWSEPPLRDGDVEVFHVGRQRGWGEDVLARVAKVRARISDRLGGAAAGPVRVLLAPDDAAFAALVGADRGEWADGVARPEERTLILRPGSPDPALLAHEVAHLVLGEAERSGKEPFPRWFHEGVAQWVSGAGLFRAPEELHLAFASRRVIPLEILTVTFPEGEAPLRLAYEESLSVVRHLADRWGGEAPGRIVRGVAAGRTFDDALRETIGLTPTELDAAWQKANRPGWISAAWAFLTRLGLWGMLGLASFLIWFVVRAREREKLELMKAEEEGEGPAPPKGEAVG